MTDVASITLSSSSELIVRRAADAARDGRTVASGQIRVEARSQAIEAVSRKKILASKPEADNKNSSKGDSHSKAKVIAFEADKMIASSDDAIIVGSHNALAVRVGKADYNGEIHLVINPRGRINVINVLPLERYLKGVVPAELPPGSPAHFEALKAQAIAARSYALASLGRYRKEGFDLRDDARSQVYGGLSIEHPLSSRAVEETRGMAALYFSEDGRGTPIEALYSSSCGGHTEDNEAVFFGKAIPYLRAIACPIDTPSTAHREIVSRVMTGSLASADGRLIAREFALLEVMGFALPRLVNNQYLRGMASHVEMRDWLERAATLTRRDRLQSSPSDMTRLPAFASRVAAFVYGEGRATAMISPAEADYILAGLGGEDLSRESRADVAMLLKEGILRLPADGRINARASVTRAYAIETLARGLLKSQISHLKSDPMVRQSIARPAENGRLVIRPSETGSRPNAFTVRAASSTTSAASKANEGKANLARQPYMQDAEIEIEADAWLFRRYAGESYAVERLVLIGGERIIYHVNASGRVDFLEAEVAASNRSTDSISQWRERVTAGELQRRLARAGVNVGEIDKLVPVGYAASSRVLELEVLGSQGRERLRGYHVRNALGLKDSMFVIDEERDERGRAVAFVFTGRGWGHGVGMCQTGAAGMSKAGHSYTQIIQKYYTGVKVQKVY